MFCITMIQHETKFVVVGGTGGIPPVERLKRFCIRGVIDLLGAFSCLKLLPPPNVRVEASVTPPARDFYEGTRFIMRNRAQGLIFKVS